MFIVLPVPRPSECTQYTCQSCCTLVIGRGFLNAEAGISLSAATTESYIYTYLAIYRMAQVVAHSVPPSGIVEHEQPKAATCALVGQSPAGVNYWDAHQRRLISKENDTPSPL